MGRFFDKLEKLDVLTIFYVVIVCFFALVAMHGWPKGSWGFGWTALAAIGGISAGAGAFYAAIVALKVSAQQAERESEAKKLRAEVDAFTLYPKVRVIYFQLNRCINLYKTGETQELGTQTATLMSQIERLDPALIVSYANTSKSEACILAEIISYIDVFYWQARSSGKDLSEGYDWVAAFYSGANGGERLEIYCGMLDGISQNMNERNVGMELRVHVDPEIHVPPAD